MKPVTVQLTKPLETRLRDRQQHYALAEGLTSRSQLVRRAISFWLDHEERGRGRSADEDEPAAHDNNGGDYGQQEAAGV